MEKPEDFLDGYIQTTIFEYIFRHLDDNKVWGLLVDNKVWGYLMTTRLGVIGFDFVKYLCWFIDPFIKPIYQTRYKFLELFQGGYENNLLPTPAKMSVLDFENGFRK